ncbi:coniferyl-alcohol dehydrogenase [Hydrogenophaga sp. OTU3427]|uniref:coniferyl-alcohol dehydrogenase n=1 Tax=Hydrogenophaga sp. OTU3427 TaxID=3043856 RepID=UPI00313CDEDF
MPLSIQRDSVLQGKTIVVTGASSGIGAATANLAAEQGADVIAVDIHPPAQNVGTFFQADLAEKASIDRLVASLPSGIHGLANIAGLPPTRPATQVLAVNLVGLKYLTLQLLPRLADGAAIVNLASLAGRGWREAKPALDACDDLDFEGIPAFCVQHRMEGARSYFFSKEALVVWTLQNRWRWITRGIRMNAVSPGPVETPILQDFLQTLGEHATHRAQVMDRLARPADIAPVVTFLLSDGSAWIRGTNIPVDGGMDAHVTCTQHEL